MCFGIAEGAMLAMAATSAASAGASASGKKGGGGGAPEVDTSAQNALALSQQRIAEDIYRRSTPIRDQVFGDILTTLQGGSSPALAAAFGPARDAIEQQAGAARRAIIEGNPARGGQMNRNLANLDIARAQQASGLEAQLRQNAFNMGYGIAGAAPGQALQGLGSAAGTFGNISNLQMQQQALEAQQQAALGQGLGSLAGMGLMSYGMKNAGGGGRFVSGLGMPTVPAP